MKNIKSKIGQDIKVHNTWDFIKTWDDGGRENYLDKILKRIKSFLKEGTDLGRVKKCYVKTDEEYDWFYYHINDMVIKVSISYGLNLNGGTWITIDEIIIENVDNLLTTA